MDWFAGTQGAASAVRGREVVEPPPPVSPVVAWWQAERAAQGPRRFAWGAVAFILGLMGYFARCRWNRRWRWRRCWRLLAG